VDDMDTSKYCVVRIDEYENMEAEIERLQEWKSVADLFGVAFRVDEWGQYPPSNGDDVHKAVIAYERLKTKEARRG
jgi:hypothetical protein